MRALLCCVYEVCLAVQEHISVVGGKKKMYTVAPNSPSEKVYSFIASVVYP